MKTLLTTLTLALALSAPSAHAKTLTIALDKSGSNPLLSDPNFAKSVAQYAAKLITPLQEGDVVRIRSFGARDAADNLLAQELVLSRRLRAHHVAQAVQKYIAGFPARTAQSQSSTNIVAYLEFESGFDCSNGGEVLLLTDALEASEYISPEDFKSGKKTLPKPDVDLAGCAVTFYGVGAGMKPKAVKNLLGGWRAYFEGTGASFNPITF